MNLSEELLINFIKINNGKANGIFVILGYFHKGKISDSWDSKGFSCIYAQGQGRLE